MLFHCACTDVKGFCHLCIFRVLKVAHVENLVGRWRQLGEHLLYNQFVVGRIMSIELFCYMYIFFRIACLLFVMSHVVENSIAPRSGKIGIKSVGSDFVYMIP